MSGPDAGISWLAGESLAQHALLDSLADGAWLVDGDSLTVRCANGAAERWLGVAPGELIGRDADTLLPTLEDAAFWADVRDGLRAPLSTEVDWTPPDGPPATLLRRIVAVPDSGPHPAWLVTLRDLSRERLAERERERLLAELRATLEATADGILVTDLDGNIQAFNRRFAALWSLPETALTERDDARVRAWLKLNVAQPEAYQRRLDELQHHTLMSATDTVRLVDGTVLECHTQPQWSQGRPIGRVFCWREVNRVRPGAPRRSQAGELDEWTRLPHRGAFVARLDSVLAQARSSGASLSLLCVEFDRLALYGRGGEAGAQARSLADLAEGLRAGLRAPHLLARLGSARFGVLIEHAGDAAAEAVARRWLEQSTRTVPGPLALAGLAPVVGIASYPHAGLCADELLSSAETALTQAHRAGEGYRVHRFAATTEPQRQHRLEQALRDGLATPQFRLHYQPRIDPRDGRVQAVEALVRWRDDSHVELPPSQFLPQVEKAGLSGTLDDWVLEQAVRQAVAWRAAGLDLPMTINVGATSLTRPGYARRLEAVLHQAGWPAARLEVDITEAALRADPDAALATLLALRSMGVRVVLDDFGVGDTALSVLRRFPLSAVKIDRSLLRGIPASQGDAALVSGLIALAQALKLPVLAEGVETEAQRRYVVERGCAGWQGFLHAPALDAVRLMQQCTRQAGGLAAVGA